MPQKIFLRLLIAVAALGAIAVTALTVYTIIAYQNCSIISFIANERWP